MKAALGAVRVKGGGRVRAGTPGSRLTCTGAQHLLSAYLVISALCAPPRRARPTERCVVSTRPEEASLNKFYSKHYSMLILIRVGPLTTHTDFIIKLSIH